MFSVNEILQNFYTQLTQLGEMHQTTLFKTWRIKGLRRDTEEHLS